jgi:Mg2+-importing ATPase
MPSRLLLRLTVAVVVLAVALPYSGPLASLFDFVPLSPVLLATMVAITVAYLAVTEAAKLRFLGAARDR